MGILPTYLVITDFNGQLNIAIFGSGGIPHKGCQTFGMKNPENEKKDLKIILRTSV